MVDWALIGVLLTVGILGSTYFFRRRILRATASLLLKGALDWAVVGVADEAGQVRPTISKPAAELFALATPLFIAEAAKTIKIKLPGSPSGLPLSPGQPLDLSTVLGMLPKRYQGIAALALPMIQNLIPGLKLPGGGESSTTELPKHLSHTSQH